MQSGIPETAAYERYGMRCRLPSYLKLGTLLGQNLRKETRIFHGCWKKNQGRHLKTEKRWQKSWEKNVRVNCCSPMLLLLVTILIMVMYPAAVSFQI